MTQNEATDKTLTQSSGKYFSLQINNNNVYLTVLPNPPDAQLVEKQITEELSSLGAQECPLILIKKTIKEASGKPVLITPLPTSVKGQEIQVFIARDKMTVSVIVPNSDGVNRVITEDVLDKLTEAGVKYGIAFENVKKACLQPGIETIVAKGLNPVDGKDAYIKYFFDVENKPKPVEAEDGRVDYKNINLFKVVHKDDILAEKVLSVPGIPGSDVLGNSIMPKPGRDIPFPLGKNVAVDNVNIIAQISGHVMLANNKIQVIPVIVVNGDVDFSSGNIEFTGNVIIKGTVQPGFKVITDGDIEILGAICGGVVEGKNVTIRMGIQGMFRGHVKATGTVKAKFIENAKIFAEEDIYVSDAILHSQVFAKKRVIAEGRRGLIAGGQVAAGEEVRAKVAGTQLAIATNLEVGINPALREEYKVTQIDFRKTKENLDQIQKSLRLLRALNQETLPTDKRELLLKLTQLQFQLSGKIQAMQQQMSNLEQEFEQMLQGKIRIAEAIFPGVRITVGPHIKQIQEYTRFTTFYAEDGELKLSSF